MIRLVIQAKFYFYLRQNLVQKFVQKFGQNPGLIPAIFDIFTGTGIPVKPRISTGTGTEPGSRSSTVDTHLKWFI